MKVLERCVHQVFKQGIISLPKDMRKEGHGDCATCTYNPKENPVCLGHRPMNVYTFEVKD